MAKKIIPLADHRSLNTMPAIPAVPEIAAGSVLDTLTRPLHDLRISVTDRCNFRCVYCMPKQVFDKTYPFLPHAAQLSFDEIARLARLFVAHGVGKIRLTGGEPLLRKHIEQLVGMLSRIRASDGAELDLALTTNGSLLAQKAQALKDAGLKRITVSLDALDEATFKRMNDTDFSVSQVLHGIDAAHRAGLPVKINMVVKRGMNEQEILPMARRFKDTPFVLRFIEYMDVGISNGWRMEQVVPSSQVIQQIGAELPLLPAEAHSPGATAQRWRYRDGSGEIGVISSVTQAFCHACTRVRLTTEGKLYTCLFATGGHDLRALLRNGHSDRQISGAIALLWRARQDRYSALRMTSANAPQPALPKVEMSYIGG